MLRTGLTFNLYKPKQNFTYLRSRTTVLSLKHASEIPYKHQLRNGKKNQKLQSSKFYSKKYMPAAYKKWSLPNARISFLALCNPLLKISTSKKKESFLTLTFQIIRRNAFTST